MCGIVYAFRRDAKPARKRVIKQYKAQKSRGSDGYGYIALDANSNLTEYHRSMNEKEVSAAITKQEASHILFHHRYPTSTTNLPEAAHPIEVRHDELKHTYFIVHNGVIGNPDELKIEHEALGYQYNTVISTEYRTKSGQVYYGDEEYNDSEALAIELARTIEGLQPIARARGTIATMVLQMNKAGTKALALYYGTNGGNPLTITNDASALVIASEGGKPIPANKMYRTDFAANTTKIVYVPLVKYEQPKPITYAGGYSYNSYKSTKYDHLRYENIEEDETCDVHKPEIDAVNEYGYTLDDLREQALDTENDIEIAILAGEVDEQIQLEGELIIINEQIRCEMEYLGITDEHKLAPIGFTS